MLRTLAIILLATQVQAKTITIAVIDTGLRDDVFNKGIGICKTGHKDFTGEGLNDTHGHGTNVSGLIHQYARTADYCQVIIKYYKTKPDPKCIQRMIDTIIAKEYPKKLVPLMTILMADKYKEIAEKQCVNDNSKLIIEAIKYATSLGVDYMNISGGGPSPIEAERIAIIAALNKKITIVAAAGNEGQDLKTHPYYPAVYDKDIIVVGNMHNNKIHPTSNYGSAVDIWEDGVGQTAHGLTLSGTSQATAIHAGKMIFANKRMIRTYESRKRKSPSGPFRVPNKKS